MRRRYNSADILRDSVALSAGARLVDRAIVYAGLGDREAALDWLERAAEDRMPSIVEMKVDPRLASLAGEPRFVALARRIGLPE
jgi:hypothetical protein